MIVMNIHLETFDEESFRRVEELAKKGPIAVSITPSHITRIKDYQVTRLKEILSREGYVLGQQGLNHKCTKCQDYHFEEKDNKIVRPGIDPWHENYCLWFGQISSKDQKRFMNEGRKKLKALLGIEPQLYVPPNHYFDINTVKIASKMGYKWLTDRALLPLKPYSLEGLIIVPEGEPEIGADQVYIHADRWRGDLDSVVSKGFSSLNEIKPEKNDKEKLDENRMKKIVGKMARDLHKGYGMPKNSAEKAAQMLYEIIYLD